MRNVTCANIPQFVKSFNDEGNEGSHLTPEAEVVHFSFEVSHVCDLRAVLAATSQKQ